MSKLGKMLLSQAHLFVRDLYDKNSRARRWFKTPLAILINICGDIAVRKVTTEHLNEWERVVTTTRSRPAPDGKTKHLSPHTIDSYKRAIRAFFNHLVTHKFIKKSPVAISFQSVSFDEPKHLSDEDVQKLMDASADDVRNHAIMHLFRASGVRLSGIAGLRLSDVCIEEYEIPDEELTADENQLIQLAKEMNLKHLIDDSFLWFYEGELTVIEKGQRGKQKVHKSLIDHDACVALLSYLRARPRVSSDQLWIGYDNAPITPGAIYAAFKAITRSAGVEASPHVMRHTFAYKMLDNGVDIKTVADMLHHGNFRTTLDVYITPRRDDIKRKYRQITRSRYNSRHR